MYVCTCRALQRLDSTAAMRWQRASWLCRVRTRLPRRVRASWRHFATGMALHSGGGDGGWRVPSVEPGLPTVSSPEHQRCALRIQCILPNDPLALPSPSLWPRSPVAPTIAVVRPHLCSRRLRQSYVTSCVTWLAPAGFTGSRPPSQARHRSLRPPQSRPPPVSSPLKTL